MENRGFIAMYEQKIFFLVDISAVVKHVAEVLRLVVGSRVAVGLVAVVEVALAVASTIVATTLAVAAIATLTATPTLAATLAARTTLALDVSLGFRDEHAVRQLVLTSLRVDFQELHVDLVAFLQSGFLNGLKTLPVDLRDVEPSPPNRLDTLMNRAPAPSW